MIKYIQIFPLLLSFLFITSLKEQSYAGLLKTHAHPDGVYCNDPHFVIHCALQDKSGRMWFATTGDGVYCYDLSAALTAGSQSFKHFTEKDGLSSNTVWCVTEDKNGTLWFGTNDGVCCYNPLQVAVPGTNTFTRFSIPGADGVNFNPFQMKTLSGSLSTTKPYKSVFSILQDKKDNMWFGTDYNGVYCYDGKNFTNYLGNDGTKYNDGRAFQFIQCMLLDKAGNMWFGSNNNGGLWRYDPLAALKTGSQAFTHFTTKDGLSENKMFTMLEDKKGNIWIATDGKGLCCYNGTSFTNFSTKDGLCNNIITSLSEDKMGNLWLGSSVSNNTNPGGICKYDGKKFTPEKIIEGFYNNDFFSSVVDRNGNIWFGGRYERLYRYDGKTVINFSEKIQKQ